MKKKPNLLRELKKKVIELEREIRCKDRQIEHWELKLDRLEKIAGYFKSNRTCNGGMFDYILREPAPENFEEYLFRLVHNDSRELRTENEKLWHLLRGTLNDPTLKTDYPEEKEHPQGYIPNESRQNNTPFKK